MRSIRRSLLGYLLLLLALTLGGVGLLVDRFADDAISAREEAATKRIEQTYETRELEAKQRFDAELASEAKTLATEVRSKLVIPTAPSPPRGPVIQVNTAPADDVAEFRRRLTLMLATPNLVGWPTPLTAASFYRYQNPAWSGFEAPRAVARYQFQDVLKRTFAEEEHPGLFQFRIVVEVPGQPWQTLAVVRPTRVSQDLPVDLEDLAKPNAEAVHDDVEIPGKGLCRQVVTATATRGRPVAYAFALSPQQPINQIPFGGPFRDRRPWDFSIRILVHLARPYSELSDRLASDQKARDEQIQNVQDETRKELTQLRTRLGLIGLGSFLAIVLGGWLLVGRGLKPVGQLSDAVSLVSEKDFHLPHDGQNLPAELAPIHARITQTLDMLRRAFAREKQAVADISHELRTPIASLLATIDVALRKPRSPDQYRTTLEDCRAIAKQLGQLVERIMTLATLDAGTARTSVTRTDGAEVAIACAAVMRPLAEAHGLTFDLAADEPAELDTDPDKLREVLMNLLHNAVEYNRPGGKVELAVSRANGHVAFEVRDTGIGMTDDVREKIFERFYRADASRHATGVHAGLGLAIVKEYVGRLNGAIAVETKPDEGSTFRVTLPASPTDAESPPEVVQSHA